MSDQTEQVSDSGLKKRQGILNLTASFETAHTGSNKKT
jgi:hypothetical protein